MWYLYRTKSVSYDSTEEDVDGAVVFWNNKLAEQALLDGQNSSCGVQKPEIPTRYYVQYNIDVQVLVYFPKSHWLTKSGISEDTTHYHI